MNSPNKIEIQIMKKLLRLAQKQLGLTYPNPVTAAAILQNGEIVGVGVHQKAGQAHAEVLAIQAAGDRAKNGTLLVNLEPCTYVGKTPACSKAIIDAGIKKVIYATEDPNPKVRKNPAKACLEAAGIEVITNVLEVEARMLNAIFFKNMERQMPWVIMKAGMSLDGKIALSSGESKYITHPPSRKWVHRLRGQCGAVLVGAGTVRADNPLLTLRFGLDKKFPAPTRIILDAKASLSQDYHVFQNDAPVIWVVDADHARINQDDLPVHITLLKTPFKNGLAEWEPLLEKLFLLNIHAVLVEGGQQIFTSALKSGVVDQVEMSYAPVLLGGAAMPLLAKNWEVAGLNDSLKLQIQKISKIGPDIWVSARIAA